MARILIFISPKLPWYIHRSRLKDSPAQSFPDLLVSHASPRATIRLTCVLSNTFSVHCSRLNHRSTSGSPREVACPVTPLRVPPRVSHVSPSATHSISAFDPKPALYVGFGNTTPFSHKTVLHFWRPDSQRAPGLAVRSETSCFWSFKRRPMSSCCLLLCPASCEPPKAINLLGQCHIKDCVWAVPKCAVQGPCTLKRSSNK